MENNLDSPYLFYQAFVNDLNNAVFKVYKTIKNKEENEEELREENLDSLRKRLSIAENASKKFDNLLNKRIKLGTNDKTIR